MAELFMNINDDPNHPSTMSRLITLWDCSPPMQTTYGRLTDTCPLSLAQIGHEAQGLAAIKHSLNSQM